MVHSLIWIGDINRNRVGSHDWGVVWLTLYISLASLARAHIFVNCREECKNKYMTMSWEY